MGRRVITLLAIMICLAIFESHSGQQRPIHASGGAAHEIQDGLVLETVGQLGGATNALAVTGNSLFVGIGSRLVVFDITSPGQPEQIDESDILPGVVNALEIREPYAYVAVGDFSKSEPSGGSLREYENVVREMGREERASAW